mmetsp:Transcript_9518/g.29449  ORF Transcript_9518/g.29449 Transcript_9518/m.29449 type:complete len:269 (+) Transcript_9518:1-807(+)
MTVAICLPKAQLMQPILFAAEDDDVILEDFYGLAKAKQRIDKAFRLTLSATVLSHGVQCWQHVGGPVVQAVILADGVVALWWRYSYKAKRRIQHLESAQGRAIRRELEHCSTLTMMIVTRNTLNLLWDAIGRMRSAGTFLGLLRPCLEVLGAASWLALPTLEMLHAHRAEDPVLETPRVGVTARYAIAAFAIFCAMFLVCDRVPHLHHTGFLAKRCEEMNMAKVVEATALTLLPTALSHVVEYWVVRRSTQDVVESETESDGGSQSSS